MVDSIKKLREKTSAGIMDCKKALKEAKGDVDKAVDILRKWGVKLASLKSLRAAKDGCIESYIHSNGKIGVLLEINCETDFVARNDDFKVFVKDMAMQIAASKPKYVKREDIPASVLKKEKEILKGKIDSFYEENVLMDQPFVKDPKIKIKDLLSTFIAKIGENIVIRRFVRYQLGEDV